MAQTGQCSGPVLLLKVGCTLRSSQTVWLCLFFRKTLLKRSGAMTTSRPRRQHGCLRRCNGQKIRPNSNRHRCIGGSAEKGGMSHSGKKKEKRQQSTCGLGSRCHKRNAGVAPGRMVAPEAETSRRKRTPCRRLFTPHILFTFCKHYTSQEGGHKQQQPKK